MFCSLKISLYLFLQIHSANCCLNLYSTPLGQYFVELALVTITSTSPLGHVSSSFKRVETEAFVNSLLQDTVSSVSISSEVM